MALVLHMIKQGRPAAARALVAQSGRGLAMAATARENAKAPSTGTIGGAIAALAVAGAGAGSPPLAGAMAAMAARDAKGTSLPRSGAIVTLDLVPKVLCFGPQPGSAPVGGANKAGVGEAPKREIHASPSPVKKPAIITGARTYATRGGWPCQASPEAWKDLEHAIARNMQRVEASLKEHTTQCVLGKNVVTLGSLWTSFFLFAARLALVVGVAGQAFDYAVTVLTRKTLKFLSSPELAEILRRYQIAAQEQFLEFAQDDKAKNARKKFALEVWEQGKGSFFSGWNIFGWGEEAAEVKTPIGTANSETD